MKDLIDFCREHKVGPIGNFVLTVVTIVSLYTSIVLQVFRAMIVLMNYGFIMQI